MQRKISSFFASKSSREDEISPTEVAESPPPATVSPGPSSSMVSSDSFQPPYPQELAVVFSHRQVYVLFNIYLAMWKYNCEPLCPYPDIGLLQTSLHPFSVTKDWKIHFWQRHGKKHPHTIPPSIQYGCYNRERAYWSFLSLFYTLKYAIFEEPLGDLGSPQTPRPNCVLPLQVRYSYSPESDYVAVFLCYVQLANGRGHNKNKTICWSATNFQLILLKAFWTYSTEAYSGTDGRTWVNKLLRRLKT